MLNKKIRQPAKFLDRPPEHNDCCAAVGATIECSLSCAGAASAHSVPYLSVLTLKNALLDSAEFECDNSIVGDIYENNYDSFYMNIPKWDGRLSIMKLEKIHYVVPRIVKSSQGDHSNIDQVSPLMHTYNIIDKGTIVGGLGVTEDGMYGMYTGNDGIVVLSRNKNSSLFAYKGVVEGAANLDCGNGVSLQDIYEIKESIDTASQYPTNNQYCVKMVYDLPYNTYSRIQQDGGSSQLYVESVNLFLNTFYNPSFQNDFQFILAGFVEWTSTSEPWDDSGNYTAYRDSIGRYYMANHNTLLPGVNYNFIYQLNAKSHPSLRGISNFFGIHYPNMDNYYNNCAVSWSNNVNMPYDLNQNLFDHFVQAHEVGHAVAGFHTWDYGTYTAPGLGSFTGRRLGGGCDVATCNTNNSQCWTIMSYCAKNGNSYIKMEFAPERVLDAYDQAARWGSHLICGTSPPPPPPPPPPRAARRPPAPPPPPSRPPSQSTSTSTSTPHASSHATTASSFTHASILASSPSYRT